MRNNPQAQRVLYEMHKVKWFMICLRYAHNKSEAEDMLQEGLISVFKEIKQFDPKKAQFFCMVKQSDGKCFLTAFKKMEKTKF